MIQRPLIEVVRLSNRIQEAIGDITGSKTDEMLGFGGFVCNQDDSVTLSSLVTLNISEQDYIFLTLKYST